MSDVYNIRKGYFNPYQNIQSGSFQTRLDEPTYLGFALDFGAFLRSYLPGNWTSDSFVSTNYDELPQALFCPPSNYDEDWNARTSYCAYSYLMDRNENLRAAMLIEFLAGWDELQREYQYYFQEISGLSTLLKPNPKDGIRVKDGKIKIKCIEGIDLKVKYLLNLYRKIAWDDTYQRWVLPDIYRYFKFYIYISEVRTFHESNLGEQNQVSNSVTSKLGQKLTGALSDKLLGGAIPGLSADSAEEMILSVANGLAPTIKIECSMCEFVLDSWLEDGYSINNDKAEETTFEISVKNINVDSYYHLEGFDRMISDMYDRVLSKRIAEEFLDGNPEVPYDSYANRSMMLPETDKVHSYDPNAQSGSSRTWINNMINWGKAFVTNLVKDKINDLKTMNIVGSLSLTGIINAIQSKDLVTVFGAVRSAFQKNTGIVGYSELTGKDLMTNLVKGIASSTATSPEQEALVEAAKDMLKDPYQIEISSQLSDEEILQRLANYQFKDTYDKSTGNDRSHATELDGGPDGNLVPNNSDAEAPDMNLVPNKYEGDRSEATELDGGPDGNLTPNAHNPEKPDMDMTPNKYEGDRSLSTDLDGGPDGELTPNIHDPEHADMDMTENTTDIDRSEATNLDGGPDGDLTPNIHDPEHPDMDLVPNKYDGDRSESTDLDGGPDGSLTENIHNPKHLDMDLIENGYEGDRSEATDLDGGPDGNLIANRTDIDRSEATDLDGGPTGDLTPNIHDPKHTDMDLIENTSDLDRSTATDLDGGPYGSLTDNIHNPAHEDMALTENKVPAQVPLFDLIENKPEAHVIDMSLTENKNDIGSPDIVSLTPNSGSANKIEKQLEKFESQAGTPKIDKLEPTVKEQAIPSISTTLTENKIKEDTSIESTTMTSNIVDILNDTLSLGTLTPNKPKVQEENTMKLVENKPVVEKPTMQLVSNRYEGDRSLATDLDGGQQIK